MENRFFAIREWGQQGHMIYIWGPTGEMAADLLTKGSVGAIAKFLGLREILMGKRLIAVRA